MCMSEMKITCNLQLQCNRFRTYGVSDYWGFGLMGFRTNGVSDYR